ncbi:MAG: flippase-like domain-containing protein [Caulobacter sp.]|nr:flippase-like domain-containing protein [Caulobacter sp.]
MAELAGLRRAERRVLIGVLAFVALFVLAGAAMGGGAVLDHLAGLDAGLIAGLLALSLTNYGLRLIRWQVFSHALDIRLGWGRAGLYYVAGFALTVTPGKMGEALRLWLMRRDGIPYETSASVLIGDRLSDSGAVLLLCLAGASAFAGHLAGVAVLGLVVGGVTILFLRPAVLLSLINRLHGVAGRRHARLFGRVRMALRRMRALASWKVYGGTLVLAVIGWAAEAAELWWLLRHMGSPISPEAALFVFCFAMVAGAVALLPGGLGGTELGMVGLLAVLGVPLDAAIAATAVVRVTTLWFAVGLGFAALPPALRLAGRASVAA